MPCQYTAMILWTWIQLYITGQLQRKGYNKDIRVQQIHDVKLKAVTVCLPWLWWWWVLGPKSPAFFLMQGWQRDYRLQQLTLGYLTEKAKITGEVTVKEQRFRIWGSGVGLYKISKQLWIIQLKCDCIHSCFCKMFVRFLMQIGFVNHRGGRRESSLTPDKWAINAHKGIFTLKLLVQTKIFQVFKSS